MSTQSRIAMREGVIMVFAKKWPRAKRGLIPEVVGYHLESTDASMSANWYGRKTAPFRHSA